MSDDNLMQSLFFSIFENLPRQGPGSRASTMRAFELCAGLPADARVLDLGCGVGAQTLHLAEVTQGAIVAVDRHAPNIDRLQATVKERGLGGRVLAVVADFEQLPRPHVPFDVVWSEGALYNVGLDKGLELCRAQLGTGGWLAFTDAVWRTDDPPEEVRALFADSPTMGDVDAAVARIEESGFQLEHHFALPREDWWTDFYTPMVARIDELRVQEANDPEVLTALDELAAEPELHRRHGDTYGYEFFVARAR